MITPAELEAWAQLYNLGHQSFAENEGTRAARAELNRALKEAYARELPGGSIVFRDFRNEVTLKLRALLKDRRPPTV